uniref:Uncharacterized protein n=1 Tax=Vespula pensylvanica TaxID=30213 RepID=A0A834P6W8_VESPE|nr:hypothetical protein H0235_004189 [Vespula pensylvanica]
MYYELLTPGQTVIADQSIFEIQSALIKKTSTNSHKLTNYCSLVWDTICCPIFKKVGLVSKDVSFSRSEIKRLAKKRSECTLHVDCPLANGCNDSELIQYALLTLT